MGATSFPVLRATLTCPRCGASSDELMPTDACVYFHECRHCHALLRPSRGDCCVFCSFGSVKCPPVQLSRKCCTRPS
ncbi:MAG TPA: GDCCVxC domain-containing (seleno)protein [Burkholderiales bacterium]|nr:GDCCVxC domain-containing (seleno)protein [Burkholderiales bacterium]